ncbi:MAG TPA: hypothetical protein VHL08_00570 [Dongiaceae bacterium]|jgi:hypothetical protein|nr:hypothetical protein [Dongiaceae bacterium]
MSSSPDSDKLHTAVRGELARPVSAAILAFAKAIAAERPCRAILFYGSCLDRPDHELAEGILDLYVLTDRARIGESFLLQWLGMLLPPNVYYREYRDEAGRTLRAKYAVMAIEDFHARASGLGEDISIWARFCQPSRLLWVADTASEERIVAAIAAAIRQALGAARSLCSSTNPEALWQTLLRATYGAELRSETEDRPALLFSRHRAYYDMVTASALPSVTPIAAADKRWRRWRRTNKLLNMLRLAKAAFTFEDGLSYVLWKIERHSGIVYRPSEWQKRHPLLAAPYLAWHLYRRGAFR